MKKLQTYAGWKAKVKKFYASLTSFTLELIFEGNEDICQAFAKLPDEDRACLGEWDGTEGEVYESAKGLFQQKFAKFFFNFCPLTLRADNGAEIFGCWAWFFIDKNRGEVPYTVGNYFKLDSGRFKAASFIFKPGFGSASENKEDIFTTEDEAKKFIENHGKENIQKFYVNRN